MTKQATQRGYNGQLLKRWYVFTADGRRCVTWATTKRAALRKRPGITRAEPAPSLLTVVGLALVALVLTVSTPVFAQQPDTISLSSLRINTCHNHVCISLHATSDPTESRVAYLVFDQLTGLPIIPPVDRYEDIPPGGLVINKQGTEATLITDGIALTWRTVGALSTTSSGVSVQREFGRIVRRYSFDSTQESKATITGTLRGVTVDHGGELSTETQRTITR